MLIVEFSVNFKGIGDLHIHRVKTAANGYHLYKVVKPAGYEDIEIKHHYDKGYFDLVLKVMKAMKKHGFNAAPDEKWSDIVEAYTYEKEN